MPISFSDLGGGGAASAVSTDIYLISGGVTLVEKTFEIGLYAFKTQSNSSTEASGTIEFRDASENVLNTLTLVDTDTGGTSSFYAGAIYLPQEAAFMYYSGPSGVTGWLEMSYSASVGAKRIQSITTTTADYVLAYDATAYVFGGGGGGGAGGTTNYTGGGGGGSGYLSTASVTAGTYNAVIGAGGGQETPGSVNSNGATGGTSEFGATTALGGDGGTYPAQGSLGGDGGSGGGAGRKSGEDAGAGLGGIDGADGEDQGTATGGTGSGVAFTGGFFLPASEAAVNATQAGVFYAGGNGGNGIVDSQGQSASANSASGGGGTSRTTNNRGGSSGGSGVIYLVEA